MKSPMHFFPFLSYLQDPHVFMPMYRIRMMCIAYIHRKIGRNTSDFWSYGYLKLLTETIILALSPIFSLHLITKSLKLSSYITSNSAHCISNKIPSLDKNQLKIDSIYTLLEHVRSPYTKLAGCAQQPQRKHSSFLYSVPLSQMTVPQCTFVLKHLHLIAHRKQQPGELLCSLPTLLTTIIWTPILLLQMSFLLLLWVVQIAPFYSRHCSYTPYIIDFIKFFVFSWAWWHMAIIPTLRRLRQQVISLSYNKKIYFEIKFSMILYYKLF